MTVLSESALSLNQVSNQSNTPTDASFNEVTANRFVGNVVGNATTATQLQNNFSVVFRGDVTGQFESKGVGGHTVDIKVNEAGHAKSADFTAQSEFAEHTTLADLANLATFALETETLKTFVIEFSEGSFIKGSMKWNKENSTATITVSSADLFKVGIVSVNNITENDIKSFDTTKIYFDTTKSALWFYDTNKWKNLNQYITDYLSALSDKDTELQQSIKNNQAQLAQHDTRLSELDSRVSDIEINTDLGQVTLRLNALDQKDIEHESLISVNAKAIKANETAIQNNSNSINELNTNLGELNTKVDTNKSQLDQEISNLKTKDQELNSLITDVTSVNNEQNFDISSLKNRATEHETSITNHTLRIENVEKIIPQHTSSIETNTSDITTIKKKLIDSSLTEKGLVQLTDTIDISQDKATTPKAVKDYVDNTNNHTISLIGRACFEDIGIAGQKGFGQSACEDETRVRELGFRALNGTVDPDSDNTYGVYEHEYAGLCCYIPKFWVRIGSENAPQYEIYKNNSIEIAKGDTFDTEEEALAQGYFLPRAFIDGGEIKKGFFLQKYNARVSAQNTSDGKNYPTSYITNSSLVSIPFYTMIDRAKTLGQNWNVETCFMWATHQLLTLSLAQMAKWSTWCKWFKSSRSYQYPNIGLSSTNEGLYTHNGMPNGIAGFSFVWQFVLGITTAGTSATQAQTIVKSNDIYLLKKEKSFTDLTSGFGGESDAWGTETSLLTMYDKHTSPLSLTTSRIVKWGNEEYDVLTNGYNADTKNIDELGRALCGVLPKNDNAVSANGTNQMANSYIIQDPTSQNLALSCGGETVSGNQPCFSRLMYDSRTIFSDARGFRCACYA